VTEPGDLDAGREETRMPSDFFDELLRELDEPPVSNPRISDAAENARRLLAAIRNLEQGGGVVHDLLETDEPS
jgi:hypothetical protein